MKLMKHLLRAFSWLDDQGLLLTALVAAPVALVFGPHILPWVFLGAALVVVAQIRTY